VAEDRTQGVFAMDELHGWSLVQIAGWYDSAAAIENTIAQMCGIPPPPEAGGVAVAGTISLIQVGAGRIWLVDEVGDIAASMADAVDDVLGCVTPLGEGRRRFRLSGKRVPDVLQSLVALDPSSLSFAPGRAAFTMIHRVSVLLHRLASTMIDLCVPTTFSTSLEEWISEAVRLRDAGSDVVSAAFRRRAAGLMEADPAQSL
jgi:heterotetrameric sarcosine oxidase gamma subunit